MRTTGSNRRWPPIRVNVRLSVTQISLFNFCIGSWCKTLAECWGKVVKNPQFTLKCSLDVSLVFLGRDFRFFKNLISDLIIWKISPYPTPPPMELELLMDNLETNFRLQSWSLEITPSPNFSWGTLICRDFDVYRSFIHLKQKSKVLEERD